MIPEGPKLGGTGERASSAVEFALVLPLVLVVALALLQVGMFAKDQLVVSAAARAGGREGAVTIDDRRVEEAVALAAAGLDVDRIEVTVVRGGGMGDSVAVTVLYAAPVVVPLVGWLFPSGVELTATATFRQEVS